MVRNWTDGEMLTAAAMNELASSTTMRFASAAARDAVLVAELTPVEGMTVFMLDTNLTFKYIVVGGTGYWAPQAGTLCFHAYQKAPSQNLLVGQTNVVAPIDIVIDNRNLNNWYDPVGARFTPLCPGYYQLFGGAGINCTNNASPYAVGLLATGGSSFISASTRQYGHSTTAGIAAFGFRRHTVYMNGTTDSLRMGITVPAATTTVTAPYGNSAFGAVYLGM